MEGPTPVSALIHAATMVAAGVFMLARVFFLFEPAPVALSVVLWIGLITSLLAALMATQQDDIKRILAYSTLSQLALMVAAVGLGVRGAARFGGGWCGTGNAGGNDDSGGAAGDSGGDYRFSCIIHILPAGAGTRRRTDVGDSGFARCVFGRQLSRIHSLSRKIERSDFDSALC